MSAKSIDIYGGQDPRDIPAYTFTDAAKYLNIALPTLRSWIKGRYYTTKRGRPFFKPIVHLPERDTPLLSFINLVEAYVLSGLRRRHHIDLEKVRVSIRYLERTFNSKHPLAEHTFLTYGKDVFIEHLGQLIDISRDGQLAMKNLLGEYLARVEHDPSGRAARLYPFLRLKGTDQPRSVVIDPYVSFGKPVIAGTGLPTRVVAERFKAGDTIPCIARDYGRQTEEIDEAIRYELRVA